MVETVEKFDDQQVVNLLKSPLCVGAVRKVVLQVLEERKGGQFHTPKQLLLINYATESEIPTKGQDLFIVAKKDDEFYFRIFDSNGESVVDVSASKHLFTDEQEAEDLKQLLKSVTFTDPTATETEKSEILASEKRKITLLSLIHI